MIHEANADEQELEQARAQKKVVRLQVQLAQKELQQLQDAKAECLQLNKGERTIVNAMRRHSVTEVTWDKADAAVAQNFPAITPRTQ